MRTSSVWILASAEERLSQQQQQKCVQTWLLLLKVMHNYLTNTAISLSVCVCLPISQLWREPLSVILWRGTRGVHVCLAPIDNRNSAQDLIASDTLARDHVLQSAIISLMLHQLQPLFTREKLLASHLLVTFKFDKLSFPHGLVYVDNEGRCRLPNVHWTISTFILRGLMVLNVCTRNCCYLAPLTASRSWYSRASQPQLASVGILHHSCRFS